MFKEIKEYLSKPFPMMDFPEYRFKMSALMGFFVFLFLFIFRPFGISEYHSEALIVTLGYGFVTFGVVFINNLVLPISVPNFVNPDKWTIFRSLVLNAWYIFTISLGNFYYDSLLLPDDKTNFTIFQYVGYTFAVGIFPSLVMILIMERKYRLEHDKLVSKTNLIIVEKNSHKPKSELHFIGSGSSEELKLLPIELLMVNSDGNYCDFHYLQNNMLKKSTIRISLKKVEDILNNQGRIIKTHRSFIVNLDHISKLSGNARSIIIHIEKYNLEVPVSRSYEREVTNAIRNI